MSPTFFIVIHSTGIHLYTHDSALTMSDDKSLRATIMQAKTFFHVRKMKWKKSQRRLIGKRILESTRTLLNSFTNTFTSCEKLYYSQAKM